MYRCRRALLSVLVSGTAAALIAIPLTAQAAGLPSIDSLWLQHDSIAIDSPLYPLQSWWDGFNHAISNDPTQRGVDELNQANVDLLNAYTLLQSEHSNAGPAPVPVIDPLVSGAYDTITGSNARAPLGSFGNWVTQSVFALEGRASTGDQVEALLQDYRAKQAAAVRDLHLESGAAANGLLQQNAQREADFLARVMAVSTPVDGVNALLSAADAQTTALASTGDFSLLQHAHGQGNANNVNGNGKSHASGGAQEPGRQKGKEPDPRKQNAKRD